MNDNKYKKNLAEEIATFTEVIVRPEQAVCRQRPASVDRSDKHEIWTGCHVTGSTTRQR